MKFKSWTAQNCFNQNATPTNHLTKPKKRTRKEERDANPTQIPSQGHPTPNPFITLIKTEPASKRKSRKFPSLTFVTLVLFPGNPRPRRRFTINFSAKNESPMCIRAKADGPRNVRTSPTLLSTAENKSHLKKTTSVYEPYFPLEIPPENKTISFSFYSWALNFPRARETSSIKGSDGKRSKRAGAFLCAVGGTFFPSYQSRKKMQEPSLWRSNCV